MRFKFLLIVLLIILLAMPIFSIRFNECGYGEGRFSTGEDCPGTGGESEGSSSGGETLTTAPEEIPELPVLPSEVPLGQEIISVAVTEVTESHVDMEVVSRTDEGEIETADIGLDLESEEIAPGVSVEVPSLDLDLDIKDVNIYPTIDTDLGPNYGYLAITVLFLANLVLISSIAKNISPKINKYYKSKKAQLFIIAAIIFIFALYSVVIKYNTAKSYTGLEDFKYLSDNYKSEFPKVANLALYTGKLAPAEALTIFSGAFVQQARAKDPNFGVFYLFKDSTGDLHIVNMLNKKAIIMDFTDPTVGDQVTIGLQSDGNPSDGQICIKGGDCVGSETGVGTFDEAYFKTNIDNNKLPDKLKITKQGETLPFNVPLKEVGFTGLTYTTTNTETFLGGFDQVAVSITEY